MNIKECLHLANKYLSLNTSIIESIHSNLNTIIFVCQNTFNIKK